MAEGAALEMLCAGNRTGGSNPPLSVGAHCAPQACYNCIEGCAVTGFFCAFCDSVVLVLCQGNLNPGGFAGIAVTFRESAKKDIDAWGA